MEIITKHHNTNNNIITYNINKFNNKEVFDKLLEVIEKISNDGFKSNLKRCKKYPNNLYFSQFNNKFNTLENNKYKMKILTLEPNARNYINLDILKCQKIDEVSKYSNYLTY